MPPVAYSICRVAMRRECCNNTAPCIRQLQVLTVRKRVGGTSLSWVSERDRHKGTSMFVMSQTNFIMTRVEQVVWPFTTINMLITIFSSKYWLSRNTPFTTDIQYSICVSVAFCIQHLSYVCILCVLGSSDLFSVFGLFVPVRRWLASMPQPQNVYSCLSSIHPLTTTRWLTPENVLPLTYTRWLRITSVGALHHAKTRRSGRRQRAARYDKRIIWLSRRRIVLFATTENRLVRQVLGVRNFITTSVEQVCLAAHNN